jgi:hypothetical protein
METRLGMRVRATRVCCLKNASYPRRGRVFDVYTAFTQQFIEIHDTFNLKL